VLLAGKSFVGGGKKGKREKEGKSRSTFTAGCTLASFKNLEKKRKKKKKKKKRKERGRSGPD